MKDRDKQATLIHVYKPAVDLWYVSKDLQWTLKFIKPDIRLYVNNLRKKQLRELSQLIYDRTGIAPKPDDLETERE